MTVSYIWKHQGCLKPRHYGDWTLDVAVAQVQSRSRAEKQKADSLWVWPWPYKAKVSTAQRRRWQPRVCRYTQMTPTTPLHRDHHNWINHAHMFSFEYISLIVDVNELPCCQSSGASLCRDHHKIMWQKLLTCVGCNVIFTEISHQQFFTISTRPWAIQTKYFRFNPSNLPSDCLCLKSETPDTVPRRACHREDEGSLIC